MKKSVRILIAAIIIALTGCSATRSIAKPALSETQFLYMEEIYSYAKNSFSSGDFNGTIKWYDRLNENYPLNNYADESLFIKGYIYKTYFDDLKQAESCFKELINNYPKSEFANSAQFELDHLNEPDFMPDFEKSKENK